MMHFERSLGPLGLLFTAVGGMLGSSWLFAPYYVAQVAGPAAILMWIGGALIALIIAMVFAELVCMFPVSGSSARFVYFSHGVFASFIFGWIMWLGYTAVAPIETLAVLQYLASYYPGLMTQEAGVMVLSFYGYSVAALILLAVCLLNLMSVHWLVRCNILIVGIKIIIPVIITVVLVYHSFHLENFQAVTASKSAFDLGDFATAISAAGVLFAYAGYAPALMLAGETKNPQKILPWVLIGSIVLCMLIYIAVQVAFIGAQDPKVLVSGWSVLQLPNTVSPLLGTIEQAGLSHFSPLILLIAILSPLGTALIFVATGARASFALTQQGYFPQALLYLDQRGVPVLAVLASFVAGLLLFLPEPGWQLMMGFLVDAFLLCYVLAPISLIALRAQFPDYPRPFKLPFYRLWSAAALFFANLIIYWTGWDVYYHIAWAILLGLVVLFMVRHFNPIITAQLPLEWINGLWVLVHLVILGGIIYCGQSASGRHLIPDGVDVGCIALLSLFTLWLSKYRRLPRDIAVKRIEKVLKQHDVYPAHGEGLR